MCCYEVESVRHEVAKVSSVVCCDQHGECATGSTGRNALHGTCKLGRKTQGVERRTQQMSYRDAQVHTTCLSGRETRAVGLKRILSATHLSRRPDLVCVLVRIHRRDTAGSVSLHDYSRIRRVPELKIGMDYLT
jgi:hypothetical protein